MSSLQSLFSVSRINNEGKRGPNTQVYDIPHLYSHCAITKAFEGLNLDPFSNPTLLDKTSSPQSFQACLASFGHPLTFLSYIIPVQAVGFIQLACLPPQGILTLC
jgi:hypothetical protein